jgi:hypothetical protein
MNTITMLSSIGAARAASLYLRKILTAAALARAIYRQIQENRLSLTVTGARIAAQKSSHRLIMRRKKEN